MRRAISRADANESRPLFVFTLTAGLPTQRIRESTVSRNDCDPPPHHELDGAQFDELANSTPNVCTVGSFHPRICDLSMQVLLASIVRFPHFEDELVVVDDLVDPA